MGSGPIFKLPSSWKKTKQPTKLTPVTTQNSKSSDDTWDNLDVEGRITRYHLKRARQELELVKADQELQARKLEANFDRLDNMNLEGVFKGEPDCTVPKRRK